MISALVDLLEKKGVVTNKEWNDEIKKKTKEIEKLKKLRNYNNDNITYFVS